MTHNIGARERNRVTEFFDAMFQPGAGHVWSVSEIMAFPGGKQAVGVGLSFLQTLEDGPSTLLCLFDLQQGGMTIVPHSAGAAFPRPMPDGGLAWVKVDPGGINRLLIDSPNDDRARNVELPGIVEQMSWSPDGGALLILMAGHGADRAGFQGGYAASELSGTSSEGASSLELTPVHDEGRAVWVFHHDPGRLERISSDTLTVWEAVWCGSRIAVISSDEPGESAWYHTTLQLITPGSGEVRRLYMPQDQIGHLAATADGTRLALVEAACSDRGLVCGTLKLVDPATAVVRDLDTMGVEVTHVEWRDDGGLQYAGHRGLETVIADIAADEGKQPRELWHSEIMSCGEWYPWSVPIGAEESLIVAERFDRAPALMRVGGETEQVLYDFGSCAARAVADHLCVVENLSWQSADGLTIDGILVRPRDHVGPAPLVLDIHGGPVWANRHRWMARTRAAPLLVELGCSVLFPNPRGSAGYGQDFARLVRGDIGGGDSTDISAAIDHFIERGIADPARIACMGSSYGGYMAAWLAVKEKRITAAVPISPVTDWLTQHHMSHIPAFEGLFLKGGPEEPAGDYYTRSPVRFVETETAPCLLMVGARDRNTPPEQAVEFYDALRKQGVPAQLISYDRAGHSLRGYPDYIESAFEIVRWLKVKLGLTGGVEDRQA